MTKERLQEYIKAYQELLDEKHYDEISLCNGEAPGTNKNNLEQGFLECFSKGDSLMLSLQTYARLGPEKELLGFYIDFAYDADKDTISLKEMTIYNHKLRLVVLPHINSSIPDLSQAVQHIREAERLGRELRQKERQQRGHGRGLS